VALPAAHEETEPGFTHHPGAALPHLTDTGIAVTVVAGTAYGAESPVLVFSQTLYADAHLAAGARLPLPDEHAERAVYILDGFIAVAGDRFDAGTLLVFRPGDAITLVAGPASRVLLVGGAPLDGPRHLWWNFVSSRPERIEAAKADWVAGRFGVVAGDAEEFIPLPG
jgi:redox-sensitive bicupin YhaK (pirin superfamily)